MRGKYMKVFVVTACHNRKKLTCQLANMLLNQSYKDVVFLLIDDGSTDGTADAVLKIFPNTIVLRGDGNLWWGGAMHKAYKWLISNINKQVKEDDVVFFTNDDSVYENDYIEKGLKILTEHPSTMVTGSGYSLHTGERFDGSFLSKYNDIILMQENNYGEIATTRSLFMKIRDLKRIGGFRPILLPHYLSDFEFTFRGNKRGVRIYCSSEVKYKSDRSTTGLKDRKTLSLKQLFSKKCPYNPIYKTIYYFLIIPIYQFPILGWKLIKSKYCRKG